MTGGGGRKRALQWTFSILAFAAVILYGRTIDWPAAWTAITSASLPLLVIATLTNLLTIGAKAVLWWIFLRAVGVPSLGLAARASIVGAGLNNVLIANSGEAAKVLFVTRETGGGSAPVLAALALERLFDLIGYIALMAGAAYLLPMPREVAQWRFAAVGALLGVIVLFVVLLRRSPGLIAATVYPTTIFGRVRTYFDGFMLSVRSILTVPRICIALALTVVNWGTQVATYHLAAVAAHFPISLTGSVTALLTVNVGFLVRATPGNVGVFQLVYGVTAEAFGLRRDSAVAVALLLQLLQNVPVTLLGVAIAPGFILHWRDRRAVAGATAAPKRRATDDAR